ncbi:hypothetical protein [Aestuariirhabdus sp. LZHN29]|uniref:hypothetical protein n=1 Tax=Aestuariirhabdus sp. LZHN29 TaxID=3417462 RepID=UPI003CEF60A2
MQRTKPFNFIESISSQRFGKKTKKENRSIQPLFKTHLMAHQIPAIESSDGFVRSYN